ncbi:MAG: hypothetical protein D6736_08680 [Nitrospinota bacterium]|nr:MAG: hypothetical protein D6736_08680 [Nitrospinota bacterium]
MYAVIMAGGSGTRFWPASRTHLPKQFLRITGEQTLFEETLARIRPLVPDSNIYVVVNARHAAMTRQLLGTCAAEVLIEPQGCNTAACIGLAALHIRQRDAHAPILVLPSDHFVGDTARFTHLLTAAARIAGAEEAIVTLGVPPTRPETGYGYIEVGNEQGEAQDVSYFQVERFVEKPDRDTALHYLASGRYLWNSGIFVFTAQTILSEIAHHMPRLYAGLREIEPAIGSARYAAVLESVYQKLEAVSIDYGVMEKTRLPIYVLRADFGWSDVGSWQALYELRQEAQDADGNLLLGKAVAVDARQNLVYSTTKRLVALLGVEELTIVDTPDALLVSARHRSQEVRQIPELLRRSGYSQLC